MRMISRPLALIALLCGLGLTACETTTQSVTAIPLEIPEPLLAEEPEPVPPSASPTPTTEMLTLYANSLLEWGLAAQAQLREIRKLIHSSDISPNN